MRIMKIRILKINFYLFINNYFLRKPRIGVKYSGIERSIIRKLRF
jgi:hypothetical protein